MKRSAKPAVDSDIILQKERMPRLHKTVTLNIYKGSI